MGSDRSHLADQASVGGLCSKAEFRQLFPQDLWAETIIEELSR